MAVPKTKVSKSRKNMRNAANFKARAASITNCPQCHAVVRPHCVCKACGYYDGAKRIEIKEEKKD
ncbi:MAG: 50S ribosomal protein L32 [Firmicutes bacterium]|nr:50S ribosomal protein L32 [Bacillota bacterium]